MSGRLLVICPTRGRPANLARLLQAWQQTTTSASDAHLLVAVDDDDPTRPDYHQVLADADAGFAWLETHPRSHPGMVDPLNHWATRYAPSFEIVGFWGDDHAPATVGWDRRVADDLAVMGGTGIVYGDDLLQRGNLPTAVFMSANIITTLGWMAPPFLRHLWVDNAWKDLGAAAGCLSFDPRFVIEHHHPVAHKAAWDDGYQRVNHPALDAADRAAYLSWRASADFDRAVEALRQLREATAR